MPKFESVHNRVVCVNHEITLFIDWLIQPNQELLSQRSSRKVEKKQERKETAQSIMLDFEGFLGNQIVEEVPQLVNSQLHASDLNMGMRLSAF